MKPLLDALRLERREEKSIEEKNTPLLVVLLLKGEELLRAPLEKTDPLRD